MKKVFLFIFLFVILVPSLVFAQNEKKKALYFYTDSCSLCDEVDDYFSSQGLYEKYNIEKIDVSGPYNMKYLEAFFDAFGVNENKRGWPAIVFGEEMLIGSQQILDKFSSDMEKFGQPGTPIPLEIRKKLEQKGSEANMSNEVKKNVSFAFILGAAIIDSISPCSLAAVVILLSLLLFARREKNVFYIGAFFISGVFLAYFLIGFVSINFLWNVLIFSKPISITTGILAILIGFLNIRYLLNLRKFSFSRTLFSFEERSKLILRKFIIPPIVFVLGFFSNLFLIPCASRPYLATVKALSAEGASAKGIFFLILYNFVFILPMAAAIAIVYFGVRSEKIRKWRSRKALLAKSKIIHVIIGAVMIFVGIYLIQNWI
jgi:cytochrome c biogenesis protein CcdA